MLRLLDYCCPIDSSFLLLNTNPNNCIEFDILGNIMSFKRVNNIVFDLKRETYTYNIEEKWPNKLKIKGYENFRYITHYLKSLGNSEAAHLADILNKYIDEIYENEKMMSSAYNIDNEESLNCINKNIIWKKQLTTATKDFIKSMPYMIRIHCYDLASGLGNFQSVTINKRFVDLTGIEVSMNENKNCEFMSLFRSRNWVSWGNMALLIKDGDKGYRDDQIQPPDVLSTEEDIYLKDNNGKRIPGIVVLYKESWSQFNCVYSKTYVVFIKRK